MDESDDIILTVVPENFARESVEWAEIFTRLRQQLNAQDGIAVSTPVPERMPTDSKGEPITVGALIIALASAPAVIKLTQALAGWITSLGNRKVHIELTTRGKSITIDSKGISAKSVEDLLNQALRRPRDAQ